MLISRFTNILIILILAKSNGFGKTINLYHYGKIEANYDQLIGQIKIGDRLKFSNDNEFTVKTILGKGKMNLIFEAVEVPGKVIRIPLTKKSKLSINETIQGSEELKDYQTDIVPVDFAVPGEFTIQRKINGRMISLFEFINYRSRGFIFHSNIFSMNYISKNDLIKMESDLFIFLERFYLITRFGDLNSGNIVYSLSEKKWVIIDVMSGQHKAKKVLDSFGHSQTFAAFGYFLGPYFIAHEQRHSWLQVRINQLNQNVLKLRISYFTLQNCQIIFRQ